LPFRSAGLQPGIFAFCIAGVPPALSLRPGLHRADAAPNDTFQAATALFLMSRVRTEFYRMPCSFCILIVLGDLLDGGELLFVEAVQTPEAARQRIEALAAFRPGQYVIYNEETGERLSITASVEA
jgi:hypothetical protein